MEIILRELISHLLLKKYSIFGKHHSNIFLINRHRHLTWCGATIRYCECEFGLSIFDVEIEPVWSGHSFELGGNVRGHSGYTALGDEERQIGRKEACQEPETKPLRPITS